MAVTTDTVGTLSGVENTWISPAGKFRGTPYFDCDDLTFGKCLKGKQKGAHWNTFMGKNDFTKGVKTWLQANKNQNFMLRNTKDNSFIYAHKVM